MSPSDQPAVTGTVTPSRPEPIGVPPGTHNTWPAMSRLRRNLSTTRSRGRKPSAESARVVADAGVAVLDRELRAAVVDDAERHQQRADQLEAAAEMIDVVDLRERDQRLDRDRRGGLLERRERAVRASSASAGALRSSANGSTSDRISSPSVGVCFNSAGCERSAARTDAGAQPDWAAARISVTGSISPTKAGCR